MFSLSTAGVVKGDALFGKVVLWPPNLLAKAQQAEDEKKADDTLADDTNAEDTRVEVQGRDVEDTGISGGHALFLSYSPLLL